MLYCISMVAGGYVLLATAGSCPVSAPQCHPAVRIEDTHAHEGGGVSIQIVNQPRLNELTRDGWQWVRVRDDQPLLVCLSQPKK